MAVHAVATMPPDTMNIAGVSMTRASGYDSFADGIDVEVIKYIWDLGDGSIALGPEISHVYQTPGTKTITLSVIGDKFSQDSITITVTVTAFAGKAYFVSSSQGDDSNPGTNDKPIKTIQRALDISAAGRQGNPDVICFKRGDSWNWSGDLFPNRPSIWIAYGAGADPVINMNDGNSIYLLNGFHTEPANTYGYSVYLNGVTFQWPTRNAANTLNTGTWGSQVVGCKTIGGGIAAAGGPEKIILKNTEITGVDYSGFFSSSNWCAVISCNIHGNGASPTFHHQIYMSMNSNVLIKSTTLNGQGATSTNYSLTFSGTRKFYVADCDLSHTNYGMNLGSNGDDDQREGQDGLVERCAIHDMGEFNQSGAFWFTRMARCLIKNCLIFNCDKYLGQAVIIFSDRKITDNTHDVRILNNTFYSNDTHEIQMGPWVKNINFQNNIVYRDTDQIFMNVDDATDRSELHFDYNNYFCTQYGPDDAKAFYSNGNKSFHDWQKTGQDTNSVWGDPKFVDAPNRNFHLGDGSAAKDMGLSIPNVWEDYERADRYKNLNYDAGALIA